MIDKFITVGVIFIILKLIGAIDWSWWWVTLPLWILFVFFGTFGLIITLMVGILLLIEKWGN